MWFPTWPECIAVADLMRSAVRDDDARAAEALRRLPDDAARAEMRDDINAAMGLPGAPRNEHGQCGVGPRGYAMVRAAVRYVRRPIGRHHEDEIVYALADLLWAHQERGHDRLSAIHHDAAWALHLGEVRGKTVAHVVDWLWQAHI